MIFILKIRKDLTGKKFGKLTVLSQNENDYVSPCGRKAALWNCICECGNKCVKNGWYLTKGDTQSCGCIENEIKAKRGKEMFEKHNVYDLSGDYGIGYTEEHEEFWFDKEDYEKIKDYYWSYDSNGYVASRDENRKTIKLHRIVMNAKETDIVDHVKHPPRKEHKFDNRKQNLRFVTLSQNSMNQHLRTNNTSGITGVSWHKGKQKWCASIGINRKQIALGSFAKFEDAVLARKNAEEKYFKNYSFEKSQNDGG